MSSDFIENLVVQTQNGDADAFGELYSVYAKDMYRFALYYTGSRFLAEDAVSDAALFAFEKIGQLKKKSSCYILEITARRVPSFIERTAFFSVNSLLTPRGKVHVRV